MSEDEKNQPVSERRGDFSNLRGLGITVLAGALYVLLFDATVEAFWNKSPVRWSIIIPVALYLGGSLVLWWRGHLLWQRTSLGTKVVVSFFVLLGLLALTAWLPDGPSNGLTLLGLSTSTLLSLATALAVAFAGTVLFQIKYPHQAIRWVIGTLAAYAVVATLWAAIRADIPYSDLFYGQSFWRVFQGAFIGALILVLTILYEIVPGVQRTSTIAPQKRRLQTLGLSISLVIVVAGLRAPGGLARSQVQPGDLGARLGPVIFARGESGGQPVDRVERFQEGIKTIYAFFDFQGLKAEDTVSAIWYRGNDQLRKPQSVRMSDVYKATPIPKTGRLWFSIDFDNGARAGGYILEISVNGRLVGVGTVAVARK